MFPERIFIIGYMCSGKSSISRKLASRLGYNSFDTDDLFEEKYHVSVNDFFEKYGEDYFRKFEAEILRKTGDLRKVVISTGGGTPCYYDNMKWMKDNGMTVFIKVSPTTAYNRLVTAKKRIITFLIKQIFVTVFDYFLFSGHKVTNILIWYNEKIKKLSIQYFE